ncbi:MAG: DUF1648 domain-containing protein [Luteolibacter sp.]
MILPIASAAWFVGGAMADHALLPEKIASHFSVSGVPDGWMSKSAFTGLMLALGLGVPAFVMGILYVIRFLPSRFLNVPNAAYWRVSGNYHRACDFIFLSSLWYGGAILIWQRFFLKLVVSANQVSPPRLDTGKAMLVTAPLLVVSVGWVVVLIMRFRRDC